MSRGNLCSVLLILLILVAKGSNASFHSTTTTDATTTSPQAKKGCTFPSFLQYQDTGIWLHRVRNQGQFGSKKHKTEVKFTGGTMVAEVMTGFDAINVEDSYTMECLHDHGNHTFMASHTPIGKTTVYMCVHFHKRSHCVVFLRRSPTKQSLSDVSCKDGMYTDNWPLVMKDPKKGQALPSAFEDFVGGYQMLLVGEEGLKAPSHCVNSTVPPHRMELACLPRDTITINFHVSSCVPQDLLMTTEEKLVILGSWEEYKHLFMVLKAEGRPNFWCARLQKNKFISSRYDAVIYLDLVCDPTKDFIEGMNRLEFELKKGEATKDTSNRSPRSGVIPEEYHGKWSTMDGENTVRFSTNIVYFPAYGQLQAMTDGKINPSGLLQIPFSSADTTGCTPTAVCIEMSRHNGNVLRYKMGQVKHMEKGVSSSDMAADLCREDMFTVTKYTHLVSKDIKETVDCDLFGPHPWFEYHTVQGATQQECNGEVKVPCENDNALQVSSNTCPTFPAATNYHACLASFPEKRGGRVIITKHMDSEALCCWIFKASKKAMFYIHRWDCDENTAFHYELYEEGKEHLTLFSIRELNDTCLPFPEPESTAMAEPEMTTAEPEMDILKVTATIKPLGNSPVSDAPLSKPSIYKPGLLIVVALLQLSLLR